MSRWTRPESVPFPTIWTKFEGKTEINGVKPKFWIQDITEDLDDMVATVMSQDFMLVSPIAVFSNYVPTEESKRVMYKRWSSALKHRLGLICFMENPDPSGKPILAGLNCNYLIHIDDVVPKEYLMDNCKNIFHAIKFITSIKNVFEMFDVKEYVGAMGLYVLPQFRRQGLATELLKARAPLCKAVGLKLTCTIFTASPSQIVAKNVGFKNIATVLYKDIEKSTTMTFPGLKDETQTLSFMYLPL